ncbi:putative disease resistance RPP13-like protein 1 [Vicia villosa]|uniref:putative disease resistance RPP13-like protein 1 n=1 Tax=Vicia villosa TaxID=3911 RepID=UPI00273CA920|nr:putative disease resistance RPP13-like protein 1 [Vicia villosa]
MAAALVGGAFLSATIQTLVEKLASKEFIDYITNTKINISLLRQLQTILLTLQAVLDDAEHKQINNLAVKQWLDDLKDTVFDAEDLLNQITYDSLRSKIENTQASNKTHQVWNFLSSPFKNLYGEINSQMKIMCENLQLFAQHKDIHCLQTQSSRVSHRTPSSSRVNESFMVGRNDEKERLISTLISDSGTSRHNNLGVVAILGMGGVGKTTLAQLVYNDIKVEQHFDLKAWICVSEDFNVVRITKSLLECVRNTTSVHSNVRESDSLDILQVELMKHLMNKRFLFVLDDIWNDSYIDWDELITPLTNREAGSKVIITTREQKVAEVARTFPIQKLEPLSDEDCWSLLSKHAFGIENHVRNKHQNLEEISRKIARKCGGLPIAAKTLGGLMRSKVAEKEWTSILNSDIWNLRNDAILPALHLSYQYLPSHLKRCFAYCSIFPKDYPLDRKKLVLLWMAEGFFDYFQGEKAAEEVGDDCFSELLSRSLIQQINDDARGEKFVMHDLVNDLASFVSGKSCCRLESGYISKNVRHLSYNQEEYDIFMKFENFYNFKCLRSFLPIYFLPNYLWRAQNYLSLKVVDDLIPTLKRLRMLSLSTYRNITKLPDSIGNLVQLRYLDLSFTRIKSLPDTTCNLYNLQTLLLFGCCDLTELPPKMGNLINLRHLDISGTDIKVLPTEIGGLENLQTLTVFVVGKGQIGLGIKELKKFSHLQGKLTIKNLHNVIDAKDAHYANLKNKERIEELELQWGKHSEDSLNVKVVLDMLQPPMKLKSLKIDLYGGTSFPRWLGDSSFSNMVSLCISNCEYCVTLPSLGQLPSLKDLEIFGMKMLETIGLEFYCVQARECSNSSFQPFPSLECIKIHDMPNLKVWLPFEGNNFAFPRLRTLKLYACHELRRHLPSQLSSIEEIEIKGCPRLLETPPTLHWLSSIKIMKIKRYSDSQRTLLESDSPCLLQHVRINCFYGIFSLPKMILSSTCLQHLELYTIQTPLAFPINGLPTSLRSLDIVRCRRLTFMPAETWSNYTSLESLWLRSSCNALKSFTLNGFPALQRLNIIDCTNLDSICMLESPSHHPSSLRSLTIICHDSIESLKVNLRMDTLTALEELSLQCAKLSFREVVCLPPKLQTLKIRSQRTTPPETEWGLQGLTSLSSLSIGGCDDIVNTLLKKSLLPTSIVSLTITYLYEMKSFEGNGLQHFSSLENLHFRNCQQLVSISENCLPLSLKYLQLWSCERLETLPEESFPDSLKRLVICQCPVLQERYKRQEHWSKITHIPVIQIEAQVTI